MESSGATICDVAVAGGGIVGLCVALECADQGLRVALVSSQRTGASSEAAAGMLAPAIDPPESPAAREFGWRALESYPGFLASLASRSGVRIPHGLNGVIEILDSPQDRQGTLSASEIMDIEPLLDGVEHAAMHPGNGWVDNGALVSALRAAVAMEERISVIDAQVRAVSRSGSGFKLETSNGAVSCNIVVPAAGAWISDLAGLPEVPVQPVRGQMLSLVGALRHVVVGPLAYAVPRTGNRVFVGSTMEHVGFHCATTDAGVDQIRQGAAALGSRLGTAPELDRWAGLRPVTPDMLPILGRDPDVPGLIWACGHSRNGILLGPITGAVTAAIASGEEPDADLTPYSVMRFRPARA